jgi:hypothetical protein
VLRSAYDYIDPRITDWALSCLNSYISRGFHFQSDVREARALHGKDDELVLYTLEDRLVYTTIERCMSLLVTFRIVELLIMFNSVLREHPVTFKEKYPPFLFHVYV